MKKNGIRISPAMTNALTRLADGKPAGAMMHTLQALLERGLIQVAQARISITPAGLDIIERAEVPHG